MKLRTIALIALAWLLLPGCSSVFSPEQLGDKPVVLDETWSGTWLAGDNVIITRVANGEEGLLQVAWLENKSDGIEMESFQVAVRARGDLVFGNVKDEETEHGYHWLVMDKKSNRAMLAWYPDADRFEKAITAELIPGKVLYPEDHRRDDVVLGDLEQKHYDLIGSPGSGLLDWKEPLVLIKISE